MQARGMGVANYIPSFDYLLSLMDVMSGLWSTFAV